MVIAELILAPKQGIRVFESTLVIKGGSVIITVLVTTQPLLSFTVAEYIPAVRFTAV